MVESDLLLHVFSLRWLRKKEAECRFVISFIRQFFKRFHPNKRLLYSEFLTIPRLTLDVHVIVLIIKALENAKDVTT